MADIIELYPDGQPYDGLVCANCGHEWWNAEILLDQAGHVTGWADIADCRKCSALTNINGWKPNDR